MGPWAPDAPCSESRDTHTSSRFLFILASLKQVWILATLIAGLVSDVICAQRNWEKAMGIERDLGPSDSWRQRSVISISHTKSARPVDFQ